MVCFLILLFVPCLFAEQIKINNKVINEKNKELRYQIAIKYPYIEKQAKFNEYVRSIIDRKINYFKKNVNDWHKDLVGLEKDGTGFPGDNNLLEISYSVLNRDPRSISILFTGFSNYLMAAHPSHDIFTANYDLAGGKEIMITDITGNDLKKVSEYCVKVLMEETRKLGLTSDEEWVRRGAGPDIKNYKSFNITKKDLIINFNEYDVSTYSEGPRRVLLPLVLFHRSL